MTQENPTSFDQHLRQAVLAHLAACQPDGLEDLHVGVMNGIVHLAGQAQTVENRQRAASLAEQVAGVRGVVNRIAAPGAPSPGRTIHLDLDLNKENSDDQSVE